MSRFYKQAIKSIEVYRERIHFFKKNIEEDNELESFQMNRYTRAALLNFDVAYVLLSPDEKKQIDIIMQEKSPEILQALKSLEETILKKQEKLKKILTSLHKEKQRNSLFKTEQQTSHSIERIV